MKLGVVESVTILDSVTEPIVVDSASAIILIDPVVLDCIDSVPAEVEDDCVVDIVLLISVVVMSLVSALDSVDSESSLITVLFLVVDSEETGIALGEVDLSFDDMDILVDLDVTVETVVRDGISSTSWYSGTSMVS